MTTPFPVLMQQAAALRQSQGAVWRKNYDNSPIWFQHSLFTEEELGTLRGSGDYDAMYSAAMKMKEEGNASLREGTLKLKGQRERQGEGEGEGERVENDDFHNAMLKYERALAVFHWYKPTDPNWRKKDLDDSRMREEK